MALPTAHAGALSGRDDLPHRPMAGLARALAIHLGSLAVELFGHWQAGLRAWETCCAALVSVGDLLTGQRSPVIRGGLHPPPAFLRSHTDRDILSRLFGGEA